MSIERFARSVYMYCKNTRGSVTSWFRTDARNKIVSGKDNSAHRDGLGADVVYDDPVSAAQADIEAKSWDLRVIHEGTHDHLQPLDWTPTGVQGAD